MKVRTRFAPSPTGALHMGSVRTALFNYLFSRAQGGVFVLRMEDTDRVRSRRVFERAIMDDLRWLGLRWDEGPETEEAPFGPYRQSERRGIYRQEAETLVKKGHAYWCTCTKERLATLKAEQAQKGLPPRYDGRCRGQASRPEGKEAALRFLVPDCGQIEFTDLVHGPRIFDSKSLGDFIILTPSDDPTYNLAAAVDDGLMKISDVIRGDDHLSNTPAQVLIMRALGLNVPRYAHLPLVIGRNRKPLGKRDREAGIGELRERGFLPLAVLNAAARLGWAPGNGLMPLEEMAAAFSMDGLSKSPSVFDVNMLVDLNRKAMARLPVQELASLADLGEKTVEPAHLCKVVEAVRPNAATLADLRSLAGQVLGPPVMGNLAAEVIAAPGTKKILGAFLDELKAGVRSYGDLTGKVRDKTGARGRALYLGLRCALTGSTKGIELEKIFDIIGPAEAARRIRRALEEKNEEMKPGKKNKGL